MHPPQRDLPRIIGRLQDRGIHTLVLTSRGPEFRASTERELDRNGYDFASTALPVRNLPGGTLSCRTTWTNLEADGLTSRTSLHSSLTEPRPVTYENGIYMTAGQPKGAMLLSILHHAEQISEPIVYADDHIRHVAYVFAAVAGRELEITGHFTTRAKSRASNGFNTATRKKSAAAGGGSAERWKRCSSKLTKQPRTPNACGLAQTNSSQTRATPQARAQNRC